MFALADCNNFFVSCERVFRPDLNGKPVIVLSNNDGCAIARSNEAKAVGIKMGDPLFKIEHIVKRYGVTVFSGNMPLYGDMSNRVRQVLRSAVPAIEVYSIDEAFLDLRGMDIDFDAFAKNLSGKCLRYTGIPVSVGVSHTKTLAKIAAKLCKQYPKLKGGCYMHRSQDIEKVLKKFPIEDVWGIGPRTVVKLHSMGVRSAYDFTLLDESKVQYLFGIMGVRTWKELRGVPTIKFEDVVVANQSVSNTRSFSKEIYDLDELTEQIATFATMTADKLRRQRSACSNLAVFVRTNRFKNDIEQVYANELVSFQIPTNSTNKIVEAAVNAARRIFVKGCGYKKAGVTASGIVPEDGVTGSLFEDVAQYERESRLMKAMDSINGSYGKGTVKLGSLGCGYIKNRKEHESPHYTTLKDDFPKVK
ncbi:MAG: Y-family DNA polymerase [Bacteroidales bacterium]|nr:Y-family DNA polymerase [Bacteroidales bacterium]